MPLNGLKQKIVDFEKSARMTKTAEPLLEQLKGNLEKDSSLREELENKIKVCKCAICL